MPPIAFPLSSYPGRRTHESAGRLINCYAEPLGPGAPGEAKIVSVAGLMEFSPETTDDVSPIPLEGYRGAILVGSNIFAAFKDILVKIQSDGTVTTIDDLDGEDRVQFSRNNKSPVPDVVATTSLASYLCTISSVTQIADADLISVISNTFQDGYTFYGAAARIVQASAINDAGNVDALDITTAEAKAGDLKRVISYDQHLWIMCDTWIEAFRNTANPTGFPFTRVAVISRGLAGAYAVTGYQDGFGKALVWVGDDHGVHILSGYSAVRISTPDVDRDIEAVADKSTLEMQCYISVGQAFVTLSSPEMPRTWEYNLTTQRWHERKSYLLTRWRGTGDCIFAFGKWLIGDTESGKLFEITTNTRKEDAKPLIYRVESAPAQDFPRGMFVSRADFNFAPGTGRVAGEEPIETDPQVGIDWSDNGGLTWSNPLLRPLGRQDTNPRITVLRTGRTSEQGRRWGVTVSDPVYTALLGGEMEANRQV